MNEIIMPGRIVSQRTKFYEFRQNNSGGSFNYTDDLDRHVYIEATSALEANSIAKNLGVYFDGVRCGMDCSCCGDRWDETQEWRAIESKDDLQKEIGFDMRWMWGENDVIAIIHTLDDMRYTLRMNIRKQTHVDVFDKKTKTKQIAKVDLTPLLPTE